MTETPAVSIVVAVKDAEDNLGSILAALAQEPGQDAEIIFVTAGRTASILAEPSRLWRTLEAAPHALIPHLWRDGILAARGRAVALTTAHCIPATTWTGRLLAANLTDYVGVGGVIDMDPRCDRRRQAIYFLRYLAFAPPLRSGELGEIAADNAIYRRDEILRHGDLLEQGFWEPSFHERFRRSGLRLWLDPSLIVAYHGLERTADFAAQRFAHGREYGSARAARESPRRRVALLARSPAVPLVLLSRVIQRAGAQARFRRQAPWTFPWLTVFILAWSLGETLGYLRGLFMKRQAAAEGVI